MGEVIHVHNVLQYNNILYVERNIPTVAPLVKEILSNQNDADIPVMSTFRKKMAHFLGINFV
jgi:hypothetical protein